MPNHFCSQNVSQNPLLATAHHTNRALALCSALLLSGCVALQPQALKPSEIAATVHADRAALAEGVEPLNGPLTLDEAIARAIKHNAESRYQAMEEAVAYGTFEVGRFDMLPQLLASAGYRDRDEDLITRSTDSVTGQPSLANPYISSERQALTTGLGFSWSLLDFGQSYFAARQNADRALIAGERRRKALHTLIQNVRTAYWRAVAAQRLAEPLRVGIANARAALADARQAEQEGLRSPLEPLLYQRQLLGNLRLLDAVQQDLSTARIQLASLTGLPPGQALRVAESDATLNAQLLDLPVEQLEEYALQQNPDLHEGIYGTRIARDETRRVLLRLFPDLSFGYSTHYSSDDYLINRHWNEASVQLSYNLLGLLSLPARKRFAEAGVALADQKRMATQMAVLTQLHVARLQYAGAAYQFQWADAIAQVDTRIATHTTHQA